MATRRHKGPPQSIDGILQKVVEGLSQIKKKDIFKVRSAWSSLAGKEFARHSRPVSLQKGILVVEVGDSSWMYQANLEKAKILSKAQKRLGTQKIKDIRFRIGEI